jgi:hypothetical protein
MSKMTSAQRFRWLALALGGVLVIAGGAWIFSRDWSRNPQQVAQESQQGPLLPSAPVSRPAPPPEGFVGSAACASCHAEECDSFAQHPMGRSSVLTPGDADVEDFSPDKAAFQAADGTRYLAEKVGGKVLHHELGTDGQGRILYDQKVAISLAIGSGTRGKTYAANHDGFLLQSPISWYSPKGGYFELSPGYENSAANPHFGRRVTEPCLVCHIGRLEFDRDIPDKLSPPYFHEIAIGCERCHGPGEKHVAAQKSGKIPSPDSTIVNPARLAMRERESVCYQCHLHGVYRGVRYGRHERDFRPGMALEEVFCVLVEDSSKGVGASKAVSQVEQMRASVCFQKSQEKMGCISCHDPHQWPKPAERAEYYRARCNDCHAERGCSLSADERAKNADSCVACHMPRATPKDIVHASQTDHRILRTPLANSLPAEAPLKPLPASVKFFDEADKRLPPWEVMRTRGMWLVLGSGGANNQSHEALPLLLPLPKVAPDDVPLLRTLGAYYLARKEYVEARKWLEQAIAVQPKEEQALAALALACFGMRDLPAAKQHIAAAVAVNPHVARNFAIQAEILAENKEIALALRAAEKAMELDPTRASLRDRLLQKGQP